MNRRDRRDRDRDRDEGERDDGRDRNDRRNGFRDRHIGHKDAPKPSKAPVLLLTLALMAVGGLYLNKVVYDSFLSEAAVAQRAASRDCYVEKGIPAILVDGNFVCVREALWIGVGKQSVGR